MYLDPYYLFVLVAATLLGSTVMTMWTTRSTLVRITSVLLFFIVTALSFMGTVQAFSQPKPTTLEHLRAEAAAVISSRMEEGVAIYVWLQVPGQNKPRYYELPWSRQLAEQLQKALQEQEKGGQAMLSMPFEKSWDKQERKFYAIPQPKSPDKPQGDPPPVYKQQDL